ncbi:unnamed protein product [Rhizoctonia solani]|uniref:Uncharacterized protein n=1 Tax=Rhizoctonia solani TaxID=456999 RepID=A0A8H3DNK9_9AGAM|nr:unnamed protein product [Rhizoctonia solani]
MASMDMAGLYRVGVFYGNADYILSLGREPLIYGLNIQGAPPNKAHPTIVSRRLTLEYTSAICRQAFPPGTHIAVPEWPNVTVVNALGDYGLAADRLAYIDGDEDPWLPATPHSPHAPERDDTLVRPFKLIRTGVHHHDENGVEPRSMEPAHIQAIHRQEIEFVGAWLKGTTD